MIRAQRLGTSTLGVCEAIVAVRVMRRGDDAPVAHLLCHVQPVAQIADCPLMNCRLNAYADRDCNLQVIRNLEGREDTVHYWR